MKNLIDSEEFKEFQSNSEKVAMEILHYYDDKHDASTLIAAIGKVFITLANIMEMTPEALKKHLNLLTIDYKNHWEENHEKEIKQS